MHGLPNTARGGFAILFGDGYTRRVARLSRGPFRYRRYADSYLDVAQRYAHVPVKRATSRDTAFAKIKTRVRGTALAEQLIGTHQ